MKPAQKSDEWDPERKYCYDAARGFDDELEYIVGKHLGLHIIKLAPARHEPSRHDYEILTKEGVLNSRILGIFNPWKAMQYDNILIRGETEEFLVRNGECPRMGLTAWVHPEMRHGLGRWMLNDMIIVRTQNLLDGATRIPDPKRKGRTFLTIGFDVLRRAGAVIQESMIQMKRVSKREKDTVGNGQTLLY
jgi:hypothetical protein